MDNNEQYHDLTLKDFSGETLSPFPAVVRHIEFIRTNQEQILKGEDNEKTDNTNDN